MYVITRFSFIYCLLMYITYKVYQMRRSATKSLSSLSLGPERKVKCYNGYFVNGYVFHTEEYGHRRKTYNNGVCVKGSTSSELEVDYYGRLEEVIELQYHSEQNRVFLFKCYWYDTTDRGIRVDPHYGLVEINLKAKEFVALQQHTAQLIKKYDHLLAKYAQLKAAHAQQRAEYAQQKVDHEQLREMVMNMTSQSGTCAPNPFWPYNHQPPPPPPAPPLY